MKNEVFLDYNQIIKVIFEFSQEDINYNFECDTQEELAKNIIENLDKLSQLVETDNPNIYRLLLNNTVYIDVQKDTGKIECINKITAFETRMLSQNKVQKGVLIRKEKDEFRSKTDLHTHLAGAFTPEILIEVAKEHDLGYPSDFLEEIGVDVSQYEINETGNILLNSISAEDIVKLSSSLKVSPITQEIFNDMEDIYRLREPFTKNKELFGDYLRALAQDYEKNGVEYVELSFSSFKSDTEYMKIIEEILPEIEQKTGVKLRFLIGLRRNGIKESNLDAVDKIKHLAQSPYIVGCDIMGHETNATDDFKEELQELAKYAIEKDPEFAIRVHAGENAMFKDNVKRALQIINDEHEKLGRDKPMPRVRIGHGLYGIDEETIKLAKKMGAIVEFNMSSNLALNNINDISDIPIKKYLENGVKVVLSTDGHGLYSTTAEQETILAGIAGVSLEDFHKIAEIENEVIDIAQKRKIKHPTIDDVDKLYQEFSYDTEDGKPRYNQEIVKKNKDEQLKKVQKLKEKMELSGAITDEKIIEDEIKGKMPILITGASKKSWPDILPKDQEHIRVLMQVLADTLDSNNTYIMTGGTNYGVEKQMHEAVYRRNEINKDKLVVLGTLTLEAAEDNIGDIAEDTITHATILSEDGRMAKNWIELPDMQLARVIKDNGMMIAIGGGGVVNDMIQRGHNLGVDMHLMNGPYGASTNKSVSLEGNDYSFKTIEELLIRLYEKNPNLFKESFDLENIQEYIIQAQETLNELPRKEDIESNFGLGVIAEIDKSVTDKERLEGLEKLEKEMIQDRNKGIGKGD